METDLVEQRQNNVSNSFEREYKVAEIYWKNVSADINGMLGGYAHTSPADVGFSKKFITQVAQKTSISLDTVLDCGAGIGRVTKHTLLPLFQTVDMVDLTQEFLDESPSFLGPELNTRVRLRFCTSLQNFTPQLNSYDAIWCQWVLSHLMDEDLVAFFRRCIPALKENGVLFVKENICSDGDYEFDANDGSVTRSREIFLDLFKKAGFKLVKELKQQHFPKELYEVRMFALQQNPFSNSSNKAEKVPQN